MISNLKVKINDKVEHSLFFAQKNFEDLKYSDLKKRPPIAYHYLYYDTQTNTTYSSDLSESNRNEIRNQYLVNKGFAYKREIEWEMVYLHQTYHIAHSTIGSILAWSFEFDKSFGISNLIFGCCFFTFNSDTVNWYVCKNMPTEFTEEYLKKNGLLLPLLTVNKLVVFDKKIDITEYIMGSSSFYLICCLPNRNNSCQLFRTRTLEYTDRAPYNSNPNNYQHQYRYPFDIYIELLPISKKESFSDININNNNNNNDDCDNNKRYKKSLNDNNNNNNNGQSNNNNIINNNYQYYFIEKYPGLKSPIEAESWSVDRVQNWLSDLLLFEFTEYFKKNRIDGKALVSMDLNTSFKSLDIAKTRIEKLKKKLIKLKSFGAKKETLYKIDKKMIVSNTTLYLKKKLVNSEEGCSTRNYNNTRITQSLDRNELDSKYSINDDKTDFKIIVQDKEINVHRAKLSKIEYFRVLFNSDFKENKDNHSKFNDEDYETFKSLLDILYLPNEEKVDYLKTLDPIQLKDILLLSNRLLYNKLQFMIENFILWNVTPENALDVYNGFPENSTIQLFTEYYLKIIQKQN